MSNAVEEVIQYLVNHRRCAKCGAAFRPENVYVLDQPDRWTWNLAAVCHECSALTMVSAEVHPGERPRRAPVRQASELTAAEQSYFQSLPPLVMDDVLDVSEFLVAFDGDFRRLFSQTPDDP